MGAGAIAMCVAAEYRRRGLSWLVAALFIAVIGGLVLVTAAGARRANTAYARFLDASRASALIAFPEEPAFDAEVARLPGVAAVAPVEAFNTPPVGTDGQPIDYLPAAGMNHVYADGVDRPKIAAGRLPRTATEAAVDVKYAAREHAHVGSTIAVPLVPSNGAATNANTRIYRFRVVGLIVVRTDAVEITRNDAYGDVLLSPAFQRRVPNGYDAYAGIYVRTRPGASAERVGDEITALGLHTGGLIAAQVGFIDEAAEAARIEHAMRPEAIALAIFSALAALAGLLALSQVLARQLDTAAMPFADLRTLGMTRRALCTTALVDVSIVAIAGAVLAGVIAVIASPLALFGAAKVVEPHPGIHIDGIVLVIGIPAIVIALLAVAAWKAWRLSAAAITPLHGDAKPAVSALGRLMGLARGRPSQRVGVAFAFDSQRGRRAVPVRSALVGSAIAVAAVTATFTFGTNLVRLVRTPKLYGQTWDVMVDAEFGFPPDSVYAGLLHGQPGVTGWSFGDYATITSGATTIPGVAMFPGRNAPAGPLIVAGRAPQRDGEVALGDKSIASLHTHLNGTVTIPIGPHEVRMTVVGRAVFPAFGEGSFAETSLGQGALLWGPQFTRLEASGQEVGNGNGGPGTANFALVRIAPGPQHRADVAHLVDVVRASTQCAGRCDTFTAQKPADVADYTSIESTPLVLALALGCFAVASLAHFLITSVRRRRHDIAVLRTIGFSRGQVSAAVAWQATVVVAVALAVGLPLGVIAGRWLWDEFATRLGVALATRLPAQAAVAAALVTIVIANLVAAGPGFVAGRLRPATALREERRGFSRARGPRAKCWYRGGRVPRSSASPAA